MRSWMSLGITWVTACAGAPPEPEDADVKFAMMSEWTVLLRDAHPGYITWDQYLENQRRLAESARALHFDRSRSAPREGPALLQGRVVCGLCGSAMHVHYRARRDQRIPIYVCNGRGREFSDPECQSIVGTPIDIAVGDLLVDAVTPMALDLTLAVQEEMQRRVDDADRLRHRQVERAQYEADLARQRYMRVDSANRLVADSLEADWNIKLRLLDQSRETYQRQRAADRLTVDDEQHRRMLALANDFPAVWRDSRTPDRERKRMLGLLIEDVTLIKQQQITVAVRFRSGATTTRTVPRPLTAQQLRATHADVRQQIDALLDEYSDAQVAHTLNQRGLRTGAGDEFDATSVQWVRFTARLPSLKDRLLAAGMVTSHRLGELLGVERTTIGRRRRMGLIQGRICNGRGEWLYWPPGAGPSVDAPAGTGVGRSPARGAV